MTLAVDITGGRALTNKAHHKFLPNLHKLWLLPHKNLDGTYYRNNQFVYVTSKYKKLLISKKENRDPEKTT